MAQVVVTINTRSYAVACGDGEEEHLLRLAAQVDGRVTARAREMGQVGDARLLLMTALLMADDIEQAEDRVRELEASLDGVDRVRTEVEGRATEIEVKSAAYIERLAARVESIASRLAAA